jgi:hypothetical protein
VPKLFRSIGKERQKVVFRAAEDDGTAQALVGKGGHGFVVHFQDALGIGKEALAAARQPDAAAAAVQQALAQHLFQTLHLHRHGRLRAPDLHRRGAQRAGMGGVHEGDEQAKIERTSISVFLISESKYYQFYRDPASRYRF